MRRTKRARVAACVLAGALPLLGAALPVPVRVAAAEDPPKNGVPLPLTGRRTVRADGKTYYIDGKQVIPGGSVIRIESNVKVWGINNASLEIKGGLLVHGTQECWVSINNVDFSPTTAPDNEIHLDMADLDGCKFVHDEKSSYDGGFTIENSCWQGSCKFAVRMHSGYLRIMTSEFKMPCRIESNPDAGRPPEIAIRTCWMKGTTLVGDAKATVRDSEVRGLLEASDFTFLEIDGIDLFQGLTLHLGPDASWSKCNLLKSNLFGGFNLVLDRPTGPKTKMEKVRVERFHFAASGDEPEMSEKQIADRITDGADNPDISVKAFVQNPQERRHVFLEPALRGRAPP